MGTNFHVLNPTNQTHPYYAMSMVNNRYLMLTSETYQLTLRSPSTYHTPIILPNN